MKKVGLWMAALASVTVGGVYAAFNYAGDFSSVSKTEARSVSVAAATTNTAAGSYGVTVTTLSILIDSAKALNKVTDEKPEENRAYMKVEGNILVTFTPNPNIDPVYATNGIPTTFSFSKADTTNDWSYIATDKDGVKGGEDGTETTQMFTVDETKTFTIGMANSQETLKWVSAGNGTFTCEIPCSIINDDDAETTDDVLTFNSDIILETAKEHDEFYNAVLKNSLKITVKANVPTAQEPQQ